MGVDGAERRRRRRGLPCWTPPPLGVIAFPRLPILPGIHDTTCISPKDLSHVAGAPTWSWVLTAPSVGAAAGGSQAPRAQGSRHPPGTKHCNTSSELEAMGTQNDNVLGFAKGPLGARQLPAFGSKTRDRRVVDNARALQIHSILAEDVWGKGGCKSPLQSSEWGVWPGRPAFYLNLRTVSSSRFEDDRPQALNRRT